MRKRLLKEDKQTPSSWQASSSPHPHLRDKVKPTLTLLPTERVAWIEFSPNLPALNSRQLKRILPHWRGCECKPKVQGLMNKNQLPGSLHYRNKLGPESLTHGRPISQEDILSGKSSESWIYHPLAASPCTNLTLLNHLLIAYNTCLRIMVKLKGNNFGSMPRSVVSTCQIYNKCSLPVKGDSNYIQQSVL
jgi:hypothetical protein